MEKLKSRTVIYRKKNIKPKTQENSIDSFIQECRSALMSLDKSEIVRLARKNGVTLPDRDDSLQIMIHKIIINYEDLPVDCKEKSKKWLISRGVN